MYLAALVASLCVSTVTRLFGRRLTMICGGVLFLAGAALNAFAQKVWMLIVGRMLLGFGIGCANQVFKKSLSVQNVDAVEYSKRISQIVRASSNFWKQPNQNCPMKYPDAEQHVPVEVGSIFSQGALTGCNFKGQKLFESLVSQLVSLK
ncbi:hypothetical protein VNO77_05409 [Canavalia gladiata]|uniref:Uncharacterized protein n=1 Tax=Canavalia gladiata TaxID=3824 RepID=A0AAN9RE44_CANGL